MSAPRVMFLDTMDLDRKLNAILEFVIMDHLGGNLFGVEVLWEPTEPMDQYKRAVHIFWVFCGNAKEHKDDFNFQVDKCPKRLTQLLEHLEQKDFINVSHQHLVHAAQASVIFY